MIHIIQLCYFLFGVLCITIRSGYSIAPAILMLIGLGLLLRSSQRPAVHRDTKMLIGVYLAYALIQGISILWDGGSLKEFDRPSRALMAILILFTVLKYPPRFLWLMNGFAIGAIGAGLRACWDRWITGSPRAFEWLMPIQAGDISMTLGFFSLCGLMWAIKNKQTPYIILYATATLMGFFGSLLSGTRGGWVLFPVIILVAYQIFKDWLSPKIRMSLGIALLSLIMLSIMPQTGVIQRIADAKNDVALYFSGNSKNTSLGLRFEFWKSAVVSFKEKPIFGWGNNGIWTAQKQQYESGLITKDAYKYHSHAHNQFLDEMAKRGIIGLSALFALFFIPFRLFKQNIKLATCSEDKTIAVCGVLLILSTIDYCLSQAFLSHNSGIVFYAVSIVLLFSCLRKEKIS